MPHRSSGRTYLSRPSDLDAGPAEHGPYASSVDPTRWGADDGDLDDTAPQPVVGAAPEPVAHHHERGAHPHEGGPSHHLSAPGHHVAPAVHGADPDVVPHHTDEPRFTRRTLLVSGAVLAVVALTAAAAFGLTRTPAEGSVVATPTASPSSSSAAPSALVTPAASGVPDATATGVAPMLPPGQPVLVLGDSLGLVVYPYLAEDLPDRYVSYEAVVGRSTPDTLARLKLLTSIPPVVIVSSGTNDEYASVLESAARGILEQLGPQRCVVWVDVVRPDNIGDTAGALNAALDRAVAGRPNVRMLRWSTLVAQHPEWMAGDGIHPNDAGAQARAAAYADAATACSPFDPSAPKAKREYLPPSVFWGPISHQYSGAASSGSSAPAAAPPAASSSTSAGSASSSATGSATSSASGGSSHTAPPSGSTSSSPAATTPAATTQPPTSSATGSAGASAAGAGGSSPPPG